MACTRIVAASLVALAMAALPSCRPVDPRSEAVQAKVNSEGHLIVHEWVAGGEERETVLRGKYGLMMFYDITEPSPTPRFHLYLSDEKLVVRTTSRERFESALEQVPAGETLCYFNTCAGGTHHGLDPSVLEGIKARCAERGVTFQRGDGTTFSICTCR